MNKIFQLILVLNFITISSIAAQSGNLKSDLKLYNDLQSKLDSFERTNNLSIIEEIGCCPCTVCLTDDDKKNRYNFPENNYRNYDSQKIHLGMLLIARVQKYPNFNYDLLENSIKISKNSKKKESEFLRLEYERQEILHKNYDNFIIELIRFFKWSNNFTPDDIGFFVIKKVNTYFPDEIERNIFIENLNFWIDYYYPLEAEDERIALKRKLELPIDRKKEKDFMEIWRKN
jgi:hypothetical protein